MKKGDKVSDFASLVYQIISEIPKGKISTYGLVAKALNKPKASRAVGRALHVNPFAPKVPCHRIIRSDGSLGGFAGGEKKKLFLLKKEGIKVKEGKIDLNKYLYRFK